ncbi:MAG: hypothetical protein NUW21_04420, partial [Elusimicrobia bacterium]|nr:hypothetical protein [Elusimicrobiota bacterium]
MRRLSTALAAAFILAALPSISSAADRRVAHTATMLTSGDVLLAGGVNEGGNALATAEIFAASLGNAIIPTGGMGIARASHTATLMTNGCVLVAGGNVSPTDAGSTATNDLLIYNPATSAWTGPTPNLTVARYNHTATLLNDGKVLICGGQDSGGNALTGLNSCEIYTPTSCAEGTIAPGPNLLQARYNHTALLLKDGKVWFAGGRNPAIAPTGGYLVTTERYDPGSNSFQSASPMIEARANHTATLMGDGKALVVGGYNQRDVLANKGITESAELYDPVSNSVSPAAAMSARRQSHAAVLSASGEVTVFGGLGNITTTYIEATGLNASANVLGAGSLVLNSAVGTVLAGSAGLIDLDFLLNKPVYGKIANGEIWLSSPMVQATWGAVRFVAASETNPGVGLRIDLAGAEVGCRESSDGGSVDNNCGNILKTGPQAALSQMQGQVEYYPLIDINNQDAAATSGSLYFTPAAISTTTPSATLTSSTSFSTTLTILMDEAFIGRSLLTGTITLSG